MLHIDVETVETGRLGDAGDLDAMDEPYGHRGRHLTAREFLLQTGCVGFRWLCQSWCFPSRHGRRFVPAIHVLLPASREDVDARDKRGDDV